MFSFSASDNIIITFNICFPAILVQTLIFSTSVVVRDWSNDANTYRDLFSSLTRERSEP